MPESGVFDATGLLEAAKKQNKTVTVERELLPTLDVALLAVYDANALDEDAYSMDREGYLLSSTRDNVQLLVNNLFNRPTTVTDDGIMASIPTESLFVLPRAKSLPKPRPPTKWERFAAAKGIISKSKKDRMVFDEDKQEWVPRYGYKGKNKDVEDQWLVEVPKSKPSDYDPRADAKADRKAKKLKNDSQHRRNETNATSKATNGAAAHDATRQARKSAVARSLLSTKRSTASLGRFDRTLPGEEAIIGKRPRGEKRKFDPNEVGADTEKERELKVLKSLSSGAGFGGKRTDGEKGVLVNARKAIRHASGGRGSHALAGKPSANGRAKKKCG